jgi:hypothetical protein
MIDDVFLAEGAARPGLPMPLSESKLPLDTFNPFQGYLVISPDILFFASANHRRERAASGRSFKRLF